MEEIIIRNIQENNLNIPEIRIPKNKIVVISGLSGSGKTSLAYDVIVKESQRRYFSSFSSNARLQIGKMHRPEADEYIGLSPVIVVDQRSAVNNSRSTVGTLTEIYDYLRLLYARLGKSDSIKEKSRSLFSFNSEKGACAQCKGIGLEDKIDIQKLINDENKSLRNGALKLTKPNGYTIYSQVTIDVMDSICKAHGFSVDIPWNQLNEDQKNIILYGSDKLKIPFGKHTLESRMKWSGITAKPREEGFYKGIVPVMEEILIRDRNPNILRFASINKCSACDGSRLNEDALSVLFDGKSIAEFNQLTISQLFDYFTEKRKTYSDAVFRSISEAIVSTCKNLQNLGLGYLALNKGTSQLNGGEIQRIRLAKQVKNKLRGIVYVLDEPSIGLHLTDNLKLMEVLRTLQSNGNSVIIIEHDEDIIRMADHLIDLGPGAGYLGGQIVAEGETNLLIQSTYNRQSKTIEYLQKSKKPPKKQEKVFTEFLFPYTDISTNNPINLTFKTKALNVLTGPSGIGKWAILQSLEAFYHNIGTEKKEGQDHPTHTIIVDQSPIGKTPRSNPATYTKLFDQVRSLFAKTKEAQDKGWDKSYFSFNTKGGRCEHCQGAGLIQIGMHFMGDVDITCPVCNGNRFSDETLEVKYKGKSVSDILDMEISAAQAFFNDHKKLSTILSVLYDLGLHYIKLGQSSTTISGGEAQRIRLATHLSKNIKGHCLYLLNEPTTGLHFEDIKMLNKALHGLTQQGHTIICIENQPDFILQSDQMIDLNRLNNRLTISASGHPAELLKSSNSITVKALRQFLSNFDQSIKAKDTALIKTPIQFRNLSINNIKNQDIDIPINKFTVITGPSGSGKSSLAFDTLFAESQSQYLESFPNYIKARLEQKRSAIYDKISGLTASVAISQSSSAKNPRSTVGTMTEIYDYYRLLYARISAIDDPESPFLSTHFSFNHEAGACEYCRGLGHIKSADPEKLITHPDESILNGAMKGSKTGVFYGDPYGQYVAILKEISKQKQLNLARPWNELSDTVKNTCMYGLGEAVFNVDWNFKRKDRMGSHSFTSVWQGFVPLINEEYARKHADKRGDNMLSIMTDITCPECNGSRLKPEILAIKFNNYSISQVSDLSVSMSIKWFSSYQETADQKTHEFIISDNIVKEVIQRLGYLEELGLGHLSISRASSSLSGGEAQRVRLAGQLGSGLTGITYIFDEPTKALHQKDTVNLVRLLKELRDVGNTVVVVEHDDTVIKQADHIIDMGPGSGAKGGKIIASGSCKRIIQAPNSLTGAFLKSGFTYKLKTPKVDSEDKIIITGAFLHNLKRISVSIRMNQMTVIHGVSGSGKSSLMKVIYSSLVNKQARGCKSFSGENAIDSALYMDQNTIGSSPLSNPATYTSLFDDLRTLFASLPESINAGFRKNTYSFNSKGGRCESCKGLGHIKVSMDFLSDVWVSCEDCKGKRYKDNVLAIKYKQHSISDILELSINEAQNIFSKEPIIHSKLSVLADAGLGYLKLGQASNTLSGGELQRLKLASILLKNKTEKTLFLFDEPTSGLHASDVEMLLGFFDKIMQQGHTLLLIEHHPEIIKQAHYLIELGPEGGDKGGFLIK